MGRMDGWEDEPLGCYLVIGAVALAAWAAVWFGGLWLIR